MAGRLSPGIRSYLEEPPMTPEQIRLVRDSFTSIKPIADEVASTMYTGLFARDPAARALFPADMAALRARFMTELEAIVTAIEDFPAFLTRAGQLGARHAAHGARPEHYRLMGEALLAALAQHLGPRMTPEVEEAWRRAFPLVAEAMMLSAADA